MHGTMAYPDARTFLANALPWGLDEREWAGLWLTFEGDKKREIFFGKPYKDLDSFISAMGFFKDQNWVKNIYACMSTSSVVVDKISEKTGKPGKAVAKGKDVAVRLKSLYLDLDVKEKAYPDLATALGALADMIREVGLPPPSAIVGSGMGAHVHWIMTEAIPAQEWEVLAWALYDAAKDKLILDAGVSTDCARILRIPQTWNNKYDPPLPVKLLLPKDGQQMPLYTPEALRGRLQQWIGLTKPTAPVTNPLATLPRRNTVVVNSDLTEGIEDRPKPQLDVIAEQCAFVKRSIDTGGADNNNPLWFATVNIATHTQGGLADLIRMAQGHADYDYDENVAKFEQVRRDGKGFVQCKNVKSPECVGCPLLANDKSPLNYGYVQHGELQTPDGMVIDLILPPTQWGHLCFGYNHGPNGHIERLMLEQDGSSKIVQLALYPMYNGRMEDNNSTLVFDTVIGHEGGVTRVPFEQAATKDALARCLARQSWAVRDDQIKPLKDFFMSWSGQLQAIKDRVVTSHPYGWARAANKLIGFSYGNKVWTNGDPLPSATQDPGLAATYTPSGEMQPWLDMAQMINVQQRPDLDAIIAGSFGSPLLAFTGHSGALLAIKGESGRGKSIAMSCAAAVWGAAKASKMNLDDTEVSAVLKLGKIRVLPALWDELRELTENTARVNMIYRLTQGIDRGRATKELNLRTKAEWQTMLITAANTSWVDVMSDVITSDKSGMYRIFEFEVSEIPDAHRSGGLLQRQEEKLNRNYGHAGLLYAQYLGANAERIQAEVIDTYDQLSKKLVKNEAERFWIATMTCVIMGARYANELKLTNINEDNLLKLLLDTLKRMRTFAAGATVADVKSQDGVLDIIAQFLAYADTGYMVKTDFGPQGRGPQTKKASILYGEAGLKELWVQQSTTPNLILIKRDTFLEWLRKNNINRRATIDYMTTRLGVTLARRKMLLGTHRPGTAAVWCLELDLDSAEFERFRD